MENKMTDMAEEMIVVEDVATEELPQESANNEGSANGSPKSKKNLKWLWITLASLVGAGLLAYLIYCGVTSKTADTVFGVSVLLTGIFIITTLGYLLGKVQIKGVSLGTAGVFLVAIAFGMLCSIQGLKDVPVLGNFFLESTSTVTKYYKSVVSNIGLVMFVASVGFIAGPNFFKDLKRNFKTYILMGVVIIITGSLVAVILSLTTDYGPEFWSGVLSGALTSTPGYSAAIEAAKLKGASDTLVTVGHAIAYPFGVIGVVLFVQLLPKFLKADMSYERSLLKVDVKVEDNTTSAEKAVECAEATQETMVCDESQAESTDSKPKKKKEKKLITVDDFGFTPFAIAVVFGLLLGAIKIPLPGGASFSLGTTGGVLIMTLLFGHFGKLGNLSLKIPAQTTKVLKELGLMLFLIGAGVEGGVGLISAVSNDASIIVWGLLGGALMTILPMVVGYFIARKALKLPLLNNLGSITGGMTSTPALGTLISTAGTEDVAGAYASTYPIALVLIVLACNLMIGLIP